MELVNTNDENSFDPTSKLKSSPIPITFVSFNENDKNCIYCENEYTKTRFSYQKYCKKCLSHYITDITDDNKYLDVYLYTRNLECNEHEINRTKEPQNIQECCRNCLEILCFKQIPVYNIHIAVEDINNYFDIYNNVIESEKYCKLCGKSLYQGTEEFELKQFKLCSDCYRISSGWIESTLTKKPIPILYLPWWHNISYCDSCKIKLTSTSDCQKYCTHCYIFYIGCRYCLTTNIIFGHTNQSECKKCKRVLSVINISSGNSDLDDFLLNNMRININDNLKIFSNVKVIDKYFRPICVLDSIYHKVERIIKWIPYVQFTNVKQIAKGGFGIIYQADWPRFKYGSSQRVILKRFENSQSISKYFLNEVNIFCYLYSIFFKLFFIKIDTS
ncbi:hypothetical protein C1645_573316 [Glomus cerebriforme]|uniref:Protein kinase domain-containing protein n=1 Tax=Glomus cerebriforme TaxID=658196 RepID=A0A397S439_9GLOM|nr:hypothetical protein C1645_573316 [Glomus cerebriforme]